MLRLVAAQNIVDEIGREADLASGLLLPWMLSFDQPADHRDLAESRLQKVRTLNPIDEFLLENIGGEQRLWIADRLEPVAGEPVIIGDEAQRFQTRALHPPGDQHAQRLMRVPAL